LRRVLKEFKHWYRLKDNIEDVDGVQWQQWKRMTQVPGWRAALATASVGLVWQRLRTARLAKLDVGYEPSDAILSHLEVRRLKAALRRAPYDRPRLGRVGPPKPPLDRIEAGLALLKPPGLLP
jgi:hypothetical protein